MVLCRSRRRLSPRAGLGVTILRPLACPSVSHQPCPPPPLCRPRRSPSPRLSTRSASTGSRSLSGRSMTKSRSRSSSSKVSSGLSLSRPPFAHLDSLASPHNFSSSLIHLFDPVYPCRRVHLAQSCKHGRGVPPALRRAAHHPVPHGGCRPGSRRDAGHPEGSRALSQSGE